MAAPQGTLGVAGSPVVARAAFCRSVSGFYLEAKIVCCFTFLFFRAPTSRPKPSSTLRDVENDDFPALHNLENHAPATVKP